MADRVSPDDLAMFRNAHQRAVAAERGVQQLQQAQQQYQQAIGALQFVNATLMERYQLQQGGSFNPETGEIVRPGQEQPQSEPEPAVKGKRKA